MRRGEIHNRHKNGGVTIKFERPSEKYIEYFPRNQLFLVRFSSGIQTHTKSEWKISILFMVVVEREEFGVPSTAAHKMWREELLTNESKKKRVAHH